MAAPVGSGFLAGLTPRERTYILVLVLVFFVMGTLVLLYFRGNSLRETEKEIAEYRLAIDDLNTRGAVYKAKMEQKKAREAEIATECIQFATLLDEARSSVENISIANEEEEAVLELGSGLSKCSYKFEVRTVTLEDLTKLLSFIESKPGQIITTENLSIRAVSNVEDRLNAEITLVTFRRDTQAAAPTGDDEAEEDKP
ncbi:MAG: hypothetical protein IAG13_07005 [Deltaproteobacteria bacterium]|nr:hypothetical protein [Nannocystaceae bacterium]